MTTSKTSERRQLILIFSAWKTLLFLLTAFCPGPGYDTSALILTNASATRYADLASSSRLEVFVLNLFRWDALYFVKAAERGLVFEQEWAFSPAFSKLLNATGRFFSGSMEGSVRYHIVAGIVVSTICHFLSVLVLHRLLAAVTGEGRQRSRVPFVASVLHILTPASLFLSAPYAESLFSLLNLAGMLCYAKSKAAVRSSSISFPEIAYKLSSGSLFAVATIIRSNGLLSGTILLYDVARFLPQLLSMRLSLHDVCRIIVTCVSGALIAVGFVGPQYLGYREFCMSNGHAIRPWCEKSVPSIYSWVQSHYWNVGLFRYWTLSNLPLFMLALPMLWLLIHSSVTILRIGHTKSLHGRPVPHTSSIGSNRAPPVLCDLPELALPQLMLALAAATSFHVQIVNRIASGYPLWYLTVAAWLENRQPGIQTVISDRGQWAVRAMVMYSMIQGMLFANFLPPA